MSKHNYHCTACVGKSFAKKWQLFQHLDQAHDKTGKAGPHPCTKGCAKSYDRLWKLFQHNDHMHGAVCACSGRSARGRWRSGRGHGGRGRGGRCHKDLIGFPHHADADSLSLAALSLGGHKKMFKSVKTVKTVTYTHGAAAPPAPPRPPKISRHEVMLSFDTTGSMYRYLESVRLSLAALIDHLFATVPGMHIGVVAHGDYCDKKSSYVIKFLPLSRNKAKLLQFVDTVGRTGGGDTPECYELALSKAAFAAGWHKSAHTRALILVGDAPPHEPGYECNGYVNSIDWRKMLTKLAKLKVQVFAAQCGSIASADSFYKACADRTRGSHLRLGSDPDGIGSLQDVISTVCLRHDKRALKKHLAAARTRCSSKTAAVLQQIVRTTVVTVTTSSTSAGW